MTVVHDSAYGFRWGGIRDDALTLHDALDWPALSVRRDPAGGERLVQTVVDAESAWIRTPAAQLRCERAARSVAICAPRPVPDADVVHPGLWPAAAVFARWHGWETVHAGAVSLDGEGAWALLGDRGAGKSSLLAALGLGGAEVLADDLLVIDGISCFAGPRCIDLRPAAADALGVTPETSLVRCTERRRLALPPCRGSYALRGFVYLEWGGAVATERMTPAASFRALVDHRRLATLGADFDHLLELAGLPALRLTRPRAWTAMDPAVNVLRRLLLGYSAAGDGSTALRSTWNRRSPAGPVTR
jgi:hypothetical protein